MSPKKETAGYCFEIYTDENGQYTWQCRADDGRVLAVAGVSYAWKGNCVRAIKGIEPEARIEDRSQRPEARGQKPDVSGQEGISQRAEEICEQGLTVSDRGFKA